MAAVYPARGDRELPSVQLEGDQIRIGAVVFDAGMVEAGVTLSPAGETKYCNRLTLTLFVGAVSVSDDALSKVSVNP